MKKILSLAIVGAALSLSACADNGMGGSNQDYGYQAPYSDSRTAGATDAPAEAKGEQVFHKGQNK